MRRIMLIRSFGLMIVWICLCKSLVLPALPGAVPAGYCSWKWANGKHSVNMIWKMDKKTLWIHNVCVLDVSLRIIQHMINQSCCTVMRRTRPYRGERPQWQSKHFISFEQPNDNTTLKQWTTSVCVLDRSGFRDSSGRVYMTTEA